MPFGRAPQGSFSRADARDRFGRAGNSSALLPWRERLGLLVRAREFVRALSPAPDHGLGLARALGRERNTRCGPDVGMAGCRPYRIKCLALFHDRAAASGAALTGW